MNRMKSVLPKLYTDDPSQFPRVFLFPSEISEPSSHSLHRPPLNSLVFQAPPRFLINLCFQHAKAYPAQSIKLLLIVSAVRKQREVKAYAQLTFSFLFSPGPQAQGIALLGFREGLSTSITLIKIIPHRYTWGHRYMHSCPR